MKRIINFLNSEKLLMAAICVVYGVPTLYVFVVLLIRLM